MTDKIIYLCGEFPSNRMEDVNSKCLILGNLASLYSVRSHPVVDTIDSNFDKTELYTTITRCHVFIFIFSKETVNDTFYLNQLGIAKAYGVPVIGVREPSYFMPNPLPEQFYFTEIVDYTGVIRDGRSDRGVHGSAKKQLLLADALIHDFKTAMVYAPEFHKSCFQRLLHKVSQAFNRSENEKKFYSGLKDQPRVTPFKELLNATKDQAALKNKIPKCPKCGFILNKHLSKTPTLQRASSTGSLLRKGDAFEGESLQQQKQLFQSKKATLQPTTIVIPAPPYSAKTQILRSSTQNNPIIRPQPYKVNEPFIGKLQSRHTTLQKEDVDKKDNKNIMKGESKNDSEKKTEQDNIKNKSLRKQSRVGNGNWTDKLRIKLRRQSSLPVIPTTYLVTSPAAGDKQLSFVKYPPESFLLSPRQSLLPIFSEDEEQETIHISRPPSPDGSSW